MENLNEPALDPEEELRIENEMKALNLELKYGGNLHVSGDLPPEILSQFLSNVTNFEDQMKEAALVPIHTFMGSPAFARPDVLDWETLPLEIERVEKMLTEHDIVVSKSEKVSDEEWYRFLVEDIFKHEIPNLRVPGMMTMLDYAEFYPDKEELIKEFTQDILFDLLEPGHEFLGEYLSKSLRDDTGLVSKEAVLNTIQTLRKRYSKVIPMAFQPEKIFGDESCTYFMFLIRWEGVPVSGEAHELHEGLGIMQFAFEEGAWKLQGVQMPGFKF